MQQEVLTVPFKAPTTRVETKNLPSGHYILHIIGNDKVEKRHLFIGNEK